MAGKKINSCISLFAIIVLASNQQCKAQEQRKHFVLVHGAGHGAWCWYKVQPLLEAAGHNVTSLDMAAAGIDLRNITELRTFEDYDRPLLDYLAALPENKKVVLVGHSQGGLNLGYAMEAHPDKIDIAIFVTAFMPDDVHPPSYIPTTFLERYPDQFLDTRGFLYDDNLTYAIFGPLFIRRLYSLSSPEDLALVNTLARPSSSFDLASRGPFSKERFGSVTRAFIVVKDDEANPVAFQWWNINNTGVSFVREIEGADHMAMISQPVEVYRALLEIAYSNSLQKHFSLRKTIQI